MSRLGTTVARFKLKKLDGGVYKPWSMLFNMMILVKPYLLFKIPSV